MAPAGRHQPVLFGQGDPCTGWIKVTDVHKYANKTDIIYFADEIASGRFDCVGLFTGGATFLGANGWEPYEATTQASLTEYGKHYGWVRLARWN
ncbi:hypothetical protein IEE94_14860 [Yimella sp. cx-573]|nr:hypothetical protein [Yimella sp. cx-573]